MRNRISIALSVTVLVALCTLPANAATRSQKLIAEGKKLLDAHHLDEAIAKFEQAVRFSPQNSEEELEAAQELLIPLKEKNDPDALWEAERRVYFLEHELHGKPVPAAYIPKTREAALADTKTEPAQMIAQVPAPMAPPAAAPASMAPVAPTASAVQRKAEDKPAPAGYAEAVSLYRAGKYPAAIGKFEHIIKAGTANDETHFYLGGCYQQTRQYAKALAEYNYVVKNAHATATKNQAQRSATWLGKAMNGICPGQCLKLSDGGWRRAKNPGEDASLMFRDFPGHGGHVLTIGSRDVGKIVFKNAHGDPELGGSCPVCNGTGKILLPR